MSDGTGRRYVVPAVEKCFMILELLAREWTMSVDEISRATGISGSTTFRILVTLEKLGYVQRNGDERKVKWELGFKVVALAGARLSQFDLVRECRPVMQWLSEKTDEFVQLGVLQDGRVVYIDQVKRPKAIAMYAEIGVSLHVNISANGMVLASHLPEHDLDDLVRTHGLPGRTPKTVTSPEALKEALAQVRRQGYAIDDGQYAMGIRCIGAPIYDSNGMNVAAIGITGHVSSMTDERMGTLIDYVVEAGRRISSRLGHPAASAAQVLGERGMVTNAVNR